MANNQDSIKTKIEGLSAYLNSLKGDPDAGLVSLQGRTDPESVKRRLAILLDAERFAEAVSLVESVTFDVFWADRAVGAYAARGDLQNAKRLIVQVKASGDLRMWNRAIMSYVERGYRRVVNPQTSPDELHPWALTAEQRAILTDIVEVASPILEQVSARERFENELESYILELVISAQVLLQNVPEVNRIAGWLMHKTPIPMLIPQLMLKGMIPPETTIVGRLRSESLDKFAAELLAAMIESRLFGKHSEAFEVIYKLAQESVEERYKRDIVKLLLELAQSIGEKHFLHVQQIAQRLLPADDPLLQHIVLTLLLSDRKLEDAHEVLKRTEDKDDAQWLQIYASYLIKSGRAPEAIEYLTKAAEILLDPNLFRDLASLAFQNSNLTVARSALERLEKLVPNAGEVAKNLAIICTRLEDWDSAARYFSTLRKLEPTILWHGLNAANSLTRAGRVAESLAVYEELMAVSDPPLEAILGWARLLKSLDRSAEAFDRLEAIQGKYWESADFVQLFFGIAYAADRDFDAHQAFLQLRRLQQLGKANADVLQQKTLDDLKESIRGQNQKAEFVNTNVVQGKLPWLLAGSLLGTPSYVAWRIRTQDLAWIADDALVRSQRCVYSTNGFAVRNVKQKLDLQRIAIPSGNQAVVADLSAFITLHRLSLLDAAAAYFGRILYPSSYHTARLWEAERLTDHQPSRVRAMEAIRSAVDSKQIVVFGSNEDAKLSLPHVNEHSLPDDTTRYYRMIDIVSALREHGVISAQQHETLRNISHMPSGVDNEHPALTTGLDIRVDISTLESLAQLQELDPVLRTFKIHISPNDYDQLVGDLASSSARKQLFAWHDDLWKQIGSDQRIHQAICSYPPNWAELQSIRDGDNSMAAAFLAQQEKMPLLADDRVCQSFILNERRDEECPAFGSDQLIVALANAGLISWDRATDCFLELISYRYRFLLVPPRILLVIVRRFSSTLPGEQMRKVAGYLHDCMRDPGLFVGVEQTTVPTSVAIKLYQSWISAIGETIAAVWIDEESFSEDQARLLTEWSMTEFLPSPPKAMGGLVRGLCDLTPRFILDASFTHLCLTKNYDRANKCVRLMCHCLGVSDVEMRKSLLELIDGI